MAKGVGSYIRKADLEYFRTVTICHYCGADYAVCIDHIIPPKEGGNSDRINLVKSCMKCNSMKSDYTLQVFFKRISDKKDKIFNRVTSNIYRLRKARNRNHPEYFQQWLTNSIIEGRALHSYYTRISVTLKTMIKNG